MGNTKVLLILFISFIVVVTVMGAGEARNYQDMV